jgi:hypothetical protein
MSYINPSPGVTGVEVTLTLGGLTGNVYTGNLAIPGLQDITINNSNDVFTWSQLDETAKLQIATTATNSLAMNIVVDESTFFGNTAAWTGGVPPTSGNVATLGVLGLSTNKVLTDFTVAFEGDNGNKFISGVGYVTGLAPTVSADAPVWVTPITITVSGEYKVEATAPDITK